MSRRAISVSSSRAEAGVAILLAVVATASVSAVAVALAVMVAIESRSAASTRGRHELLAAAEVGLQLAILDLAMPGWTPSLVAAPPTAIRGAASPVVSGWAAVDIDVRTGDLQRMLDARNRWGANGPRLHARGRGFLDELVGAERGSSPIYLMTWMADDPADGDADPDRDTNDVLDVRAEAYGPLRARVVLVATLRRHPHGVEVVSWRVPVD